MCKYCNHVKDIVDIERDVIVEHIDKHKWCNQIEDDNDAIIDFVHKFAWLMREVFCGAMCIHRHTCGAVDEFQKKFLTEISDGEIEEYIKMDFLDTDKDIIKIKLQILKHDINTHKWLNRIDNYEEGVKDFLSKFGWVIYEIYKKSKQKYGFEEK
jgi:hypothetical protein